MSYEPPRLGHYNEQRVRSGSWVRPGFWVLGSGFWVLGSGFWLLASGFEAAWGQCPVPPCSRAPSECTMMSNAHVETN